MRFLLAVIISLLLLAPANAESLTATINTVSGPVEFTLTDAACTNADVLDFIPAEFHDAFYAGSLILSGEKRALCWSPTVSMMPMPDNYIFVIDEKGATGRIAMEPFVIPQGI